MIKEYIWGKISGPEQPSSRLSHNLSYLVILVIWYFMAMCAFLYSLTGGKNERQQPAK